MSQEYIDSAIRLVPITLHNQHNFIKPLPTEVRGWQYLCCMYIPNLPSLAHTSTYMYVAHILAHF